MANVIQILTNTRTEAHGWRLGEHGRVYSGGKWRALNGMWELEEELGTDEADEALDYLSEADAGLLLSELQAAADRAAKGGEMKQLTEEATEKAARAKWAELKVQMSKDHRRPHTVATYSGSRLKQTFAFAYGAMNVVYVKRGGSVQWLLAVTDEQAVALLAGTMKLVYWKNSNQSAKLVAA
tara:strand:- start:805 stop:1350 length:546 start_codon:yes stop_codon:yes gene_type:complete